MSWFGLFKKKPKPVLSDYPGSREPSRFVVLRRPTMVFEYAGCEGAKARHAYEYNHPKEGEVLELWELGTCRGRKEA